MLFPVSYRIEVNQLTSISKDRSDLKKIFTKKFHFDPGASYWILIIYSPIYTSILLSQSNFKNLFFCFYFSLGALLSIYFEMLIVRIVLRRIDLLELTVIQIAIFGCVSSYSAWQVERYLFRYLDVVNPNLTLTGQVQITVTTAILWPIICLISHSRTRFKRVQDSIIRSKLDQLKQDLSSKNEIHPEVEKFSRSEKARLLNVIEFEKLDLISAIEEIRKISKDLEIQATFASQVQIPALTKLVKYRSFSRYVKQSMRKREISPILFSVLYGCIIIPKFYFSVSMNTFAFFSLQVILILYLPLVIKDTILRSCKKLQHEYSLVVGGMALVLNSIIFIFSGSFHVQVFEFFSIFFFSVYSFLFLYILGHIAYSASIDAYESDKENIEFIDVNALNQLFVTLEIAAVSVCISGLIHRKVQSLLILALADLQETTAEITDLKVELLKMNINNLFDTEILEKQDLKSVNKNAFMGIIEPWQKVMWVGFEFGDSILELMAEGILDQGITSMLEDALANAFRHGQADSVWVNIWKPDSRHVVISVENDGKPLDTPVAGLGFLNFSRVATNNWSLANSEKGVKFEAKLKMSDWPTISNFSVSDQSRCKE